METTQGLLLQAIPYLGKKQILKVLAPDLGLLSFIAAKNAPAPFCTGEWVYRKSEREIHSLHDFSLTDPLLHLRDSYLILSSAGQIAADLLRTQFPGKKGPFDLAHACLKKLSLNPGAIAASFRLKLLIHEGLLSEDDLLDNALSILACARSFKEIAEMKNVPVSKIDDLFNERIR